MTCSGSRARADATIMKSKMFQTEPIWFGDGVRFRVRARYRVKFKLKFMVRVRVRVRVGLWAMVIGRGLGAGV